MRLHWWTFALAAGFAHVAAEDSTIASRALVWRATPHVRDGIPECPVVIDKFEDGGRPRFPLFELVIPFDTRPAGDRGLPWATRILTQWDAAGRPRSGPLPPPAGTAIYVDPVARHAVLLRPVDAPPGDRPWPGVTLIHPTDPHVTDVTPAPNGNWCIALEEYGTLVASNGAASMFYDWPWFAFERVPIPRTRGMALLRRQEHQYSWAVLDSFARVAKEGPWQDAGIFHMSVDPSGRYLTYSEEVPSGQRTVTIDVRRPGRLVIWDLPANVSRRFSQDGRTALVLSNDFPTRAWLYDVSHPMSPSLLSQWVVADRSAVTGALSPDGSRIALQCVSRPAEGVLMAASLWDRSGRELASLGRSRTWGVFFAGRFLVVGGQRGQDVLGFVTAADQISIYDCDLLP